jgi:hypothetical protein
VRASAGGSGLATAYYRIDGGATQTYTGAAVTIPDGAAQTVSFWSVDNAGNIEPTNTTSALKIDTVAPTMTVPTQAVTVNATSPAGAIVYYDRGFRDLGSGLGVYGCVPETGSLFAIGSTTVTCDATDVAGNSATQVTFPVKVLSAAEQLGTLHNQVIGVGPGKSLADKVTSVESYLATNHKSNACGTLGAFINEVNATSGKKIAKPLASQLVTEAKQIEAVIGC